MYIPGARERVFVRGRIGVFLVALIRPEQGEADLIPLDLTAPLAEGVPFSQLEPYREDVPFESA